MLIDTCKHKRTNCLLEYPIAMVQAYNTTGSMNVLKGECTRIVETLLARIENESIHPSNPANHHSQKISA